MKKEKNKNFKQGFTLLELLVVVLIIGILAAIALPQYQLAVDKAKFSKIMALTKAIQEAEHRSKLVNDKTPYFSETDLDIPSNCKVSANNISCDSNTWGCKVFESSRCSDFNINATYIYYNNKWLCCAHTLDENDRANRLCKSITGKNGYTNGSFYIFNESLISMNCYDF